MASIGGGGLDLAITGTAIDTSGAPESKILGKQESLIVEEIIAGK